MGDDERAVPAHTTDHWLFLLMPSPLLPFPRMVYNLMQWCSPPQIPTKQNSSSSLYTSLSQICRGCVTGQETWFPVVCGSLTFISPWSIPPYCNKKDVWVLINPKSVTCPCPRHACCSQWSFLRERNLLHSRQQDQTAHLSAASLHSDMMKAEFCARTAPAQLQFHSIHTSLPAYFLILFFPN